MNHLGPRSSAVGAPAGAVSSRSFTPWILSAQEGDLRVLCGFGTVGLLLIGLAASWLMPARCQTRPIALAPGASTDTSIAMQAGRACTISVEIGPAVVRAISIATDPAHGRLMPRGRTGVIYVPDRDFKGKDTFAFALDSAAGRETGTSLVRVAATVR